ncbi:MAG: circadian clock KaiB family protein [Anaerolineales bacterium]
MARARNKRRTQIEDHVLRLFIAGDTPNSRTATRNLHRLRESLGGKFGVEIVDVTRNAQMALDHRIFATPTLQVVEPSLETLIFGDLSDRDALRTVFPESVI